jgi:hypothetical protein
MTTATQVTTADESVPRSGGVAGIGGSLLFVLVFALVIVFAGPEPAGAAAPITRFPDIRAVRTVENTLYLALLVLWVALPVALGRRLRRTRPALALVGGAFDVLGLGALAAGALPHVASVRLSDLYHASGATPGDRAALVLVWQATQGVFHALLFTGLLVMSVGVILLGLAMRHEPDFGRRVGRVSVALGTAGLTGVAGVLADPLATLAGLALFALIGFHLVAGWKAYRLSRTA